MTSPASPPPPKPPTPRRGSCTWKATTWCGCGGHRRPVIASGCCGRPRCSTGRPWVPTRPHGKAQTGALRAIRKLIDFDGEHGTAFGPVQPDDVQVAAFPRGYVRQEYAAWAWEQEAADMADCLPHRGHDGELDDGDSRAL